MEEQQEDLPLLQVIVEVRSGRWQERRQLALLECRADLRVSDLKAQAEAQAARGGDVRLDYPAPPQPSSLEPYAPPPPRYPPREPRPLADLDLHFLGEECEDGLTLAEYGLDAPFLRQVSGFVLRPRDWRQAAGARGGGGAAT